MNDRYVNLSPDDRFIPLDVLRDSYLRYEESLSRESPPFVMLDDGMELGIVSSQVPEISRAVSSILTRSLEDAKNGNAGYVPDHIIERIQLDTISPMGVSDLWGTTGHRFVLSRPAAGTTREIIASILVGRSKDTIFFLTGRYNNIRHSSIRDTVDFDQPDGDDPSKRWFDRFAMPDLVRFKPTAYHQIANFVVEKGLRGRGLARFFLKNIVRWYARDAIVDRGEQIAHSQHLLCGRGFWQVGDPPWFPKMHALGFYRRAGAESFFIEHDWAPLPPIYDADGIISNVEFNRRHGMPGAYGSMTPSSQTDQHLLDRVPEVIRLSRDPRAKLQYIQAMLNFV